VPNLFDLTGKTALITGSSQGIGLALARGLSEAGAAVVLNGRNQDTLAAAAQMLTDQGLSVRIAAFDVTDRAAVVAGIAEIEAQGPIDILVNCAGMQFRAPLELFPEDRWRQLIATNLDSVFFVSQAVAPHMIARGAGKIVNICSVQSQLGRPSIAPYAATKGLAPGYFVTDLTRSLVDDAEFTRWLEARTPAGRWGQVEELAGACVFLSSRASDFVNGQILYVDGGMTSVV
jgi:gluconate 5-dehydrogenase